MIKERIPFELAISDDLLLGKRWREFSKPQHVILKAFYGLELDDEELYLWSALQGNFLTDDLGFLTGITAPVPYVPREYTELWAELGRRSGKTTELGAFIMVYETVLGGHIAYVRAGAPCVALLLSQTKEMAIKNIAAIRSLFESSPLLAREMEAPLAESIRLKNGIVIESAAPSIKNLRGIALPVLGMDEVAFWYSDAESANPDYEVLRALTPAQAQFPHRKRFALSTPWVREGIIYDATQAGTEGRLAQDARAKAKYKNALVVRATTAMMQNPLVTRGYLEEQRAQDEDAFAREFLIQVQDAVAGFLSRSALEDCISRGQIELEPMPRPDHPKDPTPTYVAAIDPAFRSDNFPAIICHYEPGKGVVVDALRCFIPARGAHLNPSEVLDELVPLWNAYGIHTVYTDQYQFESLAQLALQRGIVLHATDFTATSKSRILGNLQQLVNRRQLQLPDPALTPEAHRLLHELRILERRRSQQGTTTIAAPPGKHDDMAMVLAIAAYHATLQQDAGWTAGDVEPELPDEHRVKTPFEKIQAMLERRRKGGDLWD